MTGRRGQHRAGRGRGLIALVLAALLAAGPAVAVDATCPDAELFSGKLITDICWACLFPIRIAGLSIGGGDRPAGAAQSLWAGIGVHVGLRSVVHLALLAGLMLSAAACVYYQGSR